MSGGSSSAYTSGYSFERIGSHAELDFSLEGIGENLKQGAKALKDKIIEMIERFINWIKGLFSKQAKNVEKARENLDEASKKLNPTLQSAKDDPSGYTFSKPTVYEELGMENDWLTGHMVETFDKVIEERKWSFNRFPEALKELKSLTEKNDIEGARALIERLTGEVREHEQTIDAIRKPEKPEHPFWSAKLRAKPTAAGLVELHELFLSKQEYILDASEAVDSSDKTAKNADQLKYYVNACESKGLEDFLEVGRKLTSLSTRHAALNTVTYAAYVMGINKYLPYGEVIRALHRAKKSQSASNESLTQRKPYWER